MKKYENNMTAIVKKNETQINKNEERRDKSIRLKHESIKY